MLRTWGNEDMAEAAPEVSRIQEAVAAVRRERVAYKVQEQLSLNLKAAERELEKAREAIRKLESGASDALDSLLRSPETEVPENYDRLKAALQLLEREVGEALIALEWHQGSRQMLDAHEVRYANS